MAMNRSRRDAAIAQLAGFFAIAGLMAIVAFGGNAIVPKEAIVTTEHAFAELQIK
jgi:hypothetical protein